MSEAFMTSPIGDLPINSEGLRTAIDEITRLKRVIAEMKPQRTILRINENNGDCVKEIPITRAFTTVANGRETLYYETSNDGKDCGCIDISTIKAWEIKGSV